MPDPLLLTATSAVSGRTAIVAEEVDSVWLYLTVPHSTRVERDCWLLNSPSAPADPDLARYRARSAPPPAPVEYILSGALREIPSAERWTFNWSPKGDAVVATVDDMTLGMVSAGNTQGVSRFLAKASLWGSPWDENLVATTLSEHSQPLNVQGSALDAALKSEAEIVRTLLLIGLVDASDVVAWADRQILAGRAAGAPVLLDLSLSATKPLAELVSLLGDVPGRFVRTDVGRRIAGELAARLASGEIDVIRAARAMSRIVSEGFAPDEDFASEGYAADDSVDLALTAAYGTLEQVGRRMSAFLERYRGATPPR